ncbi:MAG: V4R domain-containing protein [Eubacteriales bacterium]
MLDLFEEHEKESFSWGDIGDVAEGRSNLGEEMPVFVYRLFQFTLKDALIEKYSKEEAIEIFRRSGETSGMEFANHMLDLTLPFNEFTVHLQNVLSDAKIGILRIEKFDPATGHAILTVSEDLDCSGLPVTGETVCNYDEGFLAGVLKAYTQKDYVVTEVDCWATGSRVCRFEAKIKA